MGRASGRVKGNRGNPGHKTAADRRAHRVSLCFPEKKQGFRVA